MAYTLKNPNFSDNSLHTFSTLNHPLEERALEPLRSALQRGELSLRDLWLLEGGGRAQAALRLQPYPGQPGWRLGILRTVPDISDEAAVVLFGRIRELSAQGNPIHLTYKDRSAKDFGPLPARCGWRGGETYSISYRTDLSERDDLAPDPAAVTLTLGDLFSEAFKTFYRPIWQAQKRSSDERTLEEALRNLHAFAERDAGRLYALNESGEPVAMGVVTSFTALSEQAAGCNVLGVAADKRGRGWGRRLHRHLMYEAKQRADLYLGHTDAANRAMRRLFEVNGCTEDGKSWELEPA